MPAPGPASQQRLLVQQLSKIRWRVPEALVAWEEGRQGRPKPQRSGEGAEEGCPEPEKIRGGVGSGSSPPGRLKTWNSRSQKMDAMRFKAWRWSSRKGED